MRTYVVGGAVRDSLMGFVPKDVDYLVVGTTVEEFKKQKEVQQVGADFPVFLDKAGNEWAFARTERKTGAGYNGFETKFDPTVTVEEDLYRRDLTVNAMAQCSETGEVVDPYGGQVDMENKMLRHVSDAFMEDPVRVLRLARFRARLGSDWKVDPETKKMVYKMAKRGDLNELTAERVWKELSRALTENYPRLFFDTLLECDALSTLFPEVYKLKTSLESRMHHPEGDSYEHTMLVLTQAKAMNYDLESSFAALVHDFGKAETPRRQMPRHYGHEKTGVPVVEQFAKRLGVPRKMRERAMKATRYHMHLHKLHTMRSTSVVKMFDAMNVKNDPDAVTVLYNVGYADHMGRLGRENDMPDEKMKNLTEAFRAYDSVKFADVFPNGEKNRNKLVQGLYVARAKAVKNAFWK